MGLIDQIVGVESGGDPNARNPNSSAAGLGQFIDSTWLDMLAKHRPDLAGSPQELIALKSDPALSKAMTEAYAADNGQILSKAGYDTSPGNSYLAHFAGPQGAVKILGADPSAPVESVLGSAAVAANPFLKGMTAADLQAWASRKMGGAPQQPAPQPAPVSPAKPPQTPLMAPQPAPIFPQEAPQQQAAAAPSSYFGQMPAEQAGASPSPIFAPPRRAVDISKLRAALQASGNRGLFLGRG